MEDARGPRVRQGGEAAGEAASLRPCPKHMSATERLRKVIQELVDTEKSYVKVSLLSYYHQLKLLLDLQNCRSMLLPCYENCCHTRQHCEREVGTGHRGSLNLFRSRLPIFPQALTNYFHLI